MAVEPQKYFIGLIEFFSVLLPGAVLVFFLEADVGPHLFDAYLTIDGTAAWVAFLIASYLGGHIAFLVGSWLLDPPYDWLKDATRGAMIANLAAGGKTVPGALRQRIAGWLFKPEGDRAVAVTVRIRDRYLKPLGDTGTINAFQWAKARLALAHPDALGIVQGFEASSKFFRTLAIVLVVLMVWAPLTGRWVIAAATPLLLLFALARFMEQRRKSTDQAYWFTIASEADPTHAPLPPPPRPEGATHAGGVVYRRRGKGAPEFLTVRARRAEHWVLPKGHIKPHETTAQTAVREVLEESGVWARVVKDLGVLDLAVGDGTITVHYFLMEALRDGASAEDRPKEWGNLDAAAARLAPFPETVGLLHRAAREVP